MQTRYGSVALALLISGIAVAQTEVPDAMDGSGEPLRLIAIDPKYPPAALEDGIEGYVDVRFSVSPTGTVLNPEVVTAEPAGVFDAAAIAAVSRWRYSRPTESQRPQLTERIVFDLSEAIMSLGRSATSGRETTLVAGQLANDCVRETSRYDFGSNVDISLINACSRPLLIYTCAAGSGSFRNRWVCREPVQTATVIGPASARAAAAVTGAQTLASNGSLQLSRAPNSEYWWLACAVDDTRCRAAGDQWVRELDGQTITIDPQDRSQARLSRSF